MFASTTPVTPPNVNKNIIATENNIGVLNSMEPPHIVAIQLKIFIPVGKIQPNDVLGFGVFLAFMSVIILGLTINYVAATLLAFSISFYIFIYTAWLKRSTHHNIVIGGAAGAFPPVIGWASVTGDISMLPILLFLLIFVWTPPHFWALALYKDTEYSKVKIPMLIKMGVNYLVLNKDHIC